MLLERCECYSTAVRCCLIAIGLLVGGVAGAGGGRSLGVRSLSSSCLLAVRSFSESCVDAV
eukprot:7904986-Lingulodinium_polyedra.AAC.1